MYASRSTVRSSRGVLRVQAVKIGDKAPDFSLPDQNGRTFKLSSSKKPLVLYFYPQNGTPGCTKEARAFRDSAAAFRKKGAEVVGISADSVESHKQFQRDEGLPQRLLSDESKDVRKLYSVPGDLFGLLDGRQTFVIGKDGTVEFVYNDQLGAEKHIEKALEAVDSLKARSGMFSFF